MSTQDDRSGGFEEKLMAYADGELSGDEASRIEAAVAADPALAARVERYRAQRRRLAGAYAPVLDEPVPERFHALLRPGIRAEVAPVEGEPAGTPLSKAFLSKPGSPPAHPPRRRWALREWGAMAACVALGWTLALLIVRPGAGDDALVDGALVARGALARALDARLSSEGASADGVRVGLSFRDHDGDYCRGFTADGAALAGLACRGDGRWQVVALARAAPAGEGGLRQASSALPPAVLAAVDARIGGEPLDAAAERAARDAGWR